MDSILLAWLQSTDEAERERLLAELILVHATPLIKHMLWLKLGFHLGKDGENSNNPDAEDLYHDVVAKLVGGVGRAVMLGGVFVVLVVLLLLGDLRAALVVTLTIPLSILAFAAWASVAEHGTSSLANHGPHGLSEILYAYSSATGNNGSAFAGLDANTPFYDTTLGLAMLLVAGIGIDFATASRTTFAEFGAFGPRIDANVGTPPAKKR